MNVAITRKYRKQQGFLSALLARNPVLVLGLDLPFVIVCAVNLRAAVALSIEMFIIHLTAVVVAMLAARFLPRWSRILVDVGAAFIMMTIARYLLTNISVFSDISNYAGMYIYLMAVNGITIYQCSRITRRDKPWPVLASAFMNAVAFALTMLVVAAFREYLSAGTLWGIPLPSKIRLSGLAIPFGGFIIMGFLLALVKLVNKQLLALSIREAIRRDARYMQLERRRRAAMIKKAEPPTPDKLPKKGEIIILDEHFRKKDKE